MRATEKGDMFHCDCGFSWRRGHSGAHDCEKGLRSQRDELLEALNDALAWIDAVPSGTELPTMPGFDRDEVNNLIARVKGGAA